MVTFFIFTIILFSNVFADSNEIREVRSWEGGTWAVVDVETVRGTVVVLSSVVGREIDFDERSRFAIFEGETVYNHKKYLSVLQTPVVGFQSAVFLKLSDGGYGVQVTYRNEMGIQNRLLRMRDYNDLVRMYDYLEDFAGVSDVTSGYPMETDETVSFEVVRPRFQPVVRLMSYLGLDSGEKMKGELLPVMEQGYMMMETKDGFRRVLAREVNYIRLSEYSAGGVVKRALRMGVEWTAFGTAMALVAGWWEPGRSAWEEVKVVAPVVGGMGFLGTLVFDLGKVADREFHLGSLDNKRSRQLEISPTRIQLRF